MFSYLVNDKLFLFIEGMMECYKNNGNWIFFKLIIKVEEVFFWYGILFDG